MSLTPSFTFQGHGDWSLDATSGAATGGGTIQADIPEGSTVVAAFLYNTTFGGTAGSVTLSLGSQSDTVSDFTSLGSDGTLTAYRADVTNFVSQAVGSGSPNEFDFQASNIVNSPDSDGYALAIIYSNPTDPLRTITFLDGATNSAGDSFSVDFANPVDTTQSGFEALLSLGIGFSFQLGGGGQFSDVSVDGRMLTASAGGEDDGIDGNGGLITIGGIGDSPDNPPDPNAGPTGPRSDDELYNLAAGNAVDPAPFISNGDTAVTVTTRNPSGDDNIFFAGFNVTAAAVVFTGNPPPTGLTLDPASDSGVQGDDVTNVTTPVVTGMGLAGQIVNLFDGSTLIGTTSVADDGTWSVGLTSPLADGVHTLTATETDANSDTSVNSNPLVLTIDTSPPVETPATLTVQSSSAATPIGIAAPTDPNDASDALTVIVSGLPTNGAVTLSDGTPVTLNEALTVAQLTALDFAPAANPTTSTSTFAYSVTDPAGNTSSGSATLGVLQSSSLRNLFDFVFTYNDGRDYYFGTVADDGTFGYQVGQPPPNLPPVDGQYSIFAVQGTTTEAAGTVSVDTYFHSGPGQASRIPVATAAGQPDGAMGLGSESDAILGIDGQNHPFSSTSEASFQTTPLFGFVYTYATGGEFYTGTVADDGSFGLRTPGNLTVTDGFGHVVGTYTIFADGETTRAPGTVVVDRFTIGDVSLVPNHASPNAVDGTRGIGSEVGSVTLGGNTTLFSDLVQPAIVLSVPTVPVNPLPPPSDAIAAELTEIYHEVLGRDPDPAGLAIYSSDIANGFATVAQIRQVIAQSSEAQADVNGLYNQVFGRNADQAGLAAYVNDLVNGSSLDAIRLIIGQSPEAVGDLKQLYKDVLARAADGNGLTGYIAALAGGVPLAQIRDVVAHSPEAQQDLNNLFQSIIGQPPGAAELAGLEDQLSSGQSQAALQNALTATGSGGGFATVTAPAGDSTLTAMSGVPTLFKFDDVSFGNDTIAGFDPSRDTIEITPSVVPDLPTLRADISANAGGTLVFFNQTQSIEIAGVSPNQLGVPFNIRVGGAPAVA